jgi:hypothetical protein
MSGRRAPRRYSIGVFAKSVAGEGVALGRARVCSGRTSCGSTRAICQGGNNIRSTTPGSIPKTAVSSGLNNP